MKSLILLIIFISVSNSFSQSLWSINITQYPKDTSVAYLKSAVADSNLNFYSYKVAAFYLAYKYKNIEKQWLLNNLNTQLISDRSNPLYGIYLKKYTTDQIIRGYLGDNSAIPGLIAAIDSMDYLTDKLIADRYLAEAGIYVNYDIVNNAFLNSKYQDIALNGLWLYANSPNYKNEVEDLFKQSIMNSTESDRVSTLSSYLYTINDSLTLSLINQKFNEFSGTNKLNLFYELNAIDPLHQPQRSIQAIPSESNAELRYDYIPFYPSIKSGQISKNYLQPNFINFLSNWFAHESSSDIRTNISWFLHDFKPPNPIESENLPILNEIDTLFKTIDTVTYYYWMGDLEFKAELQLNIQSAKTSLQNGDSLACRSKIKSFQDTVDLVYADSLNPDPRFVTLEGWKFLHWNAQYILDRLPEPQQNPNLLVNLKNSEGTQIPASNVKYYDTSWKDAIDNGDGTFTVITTKPNISVRVFYEGANQTVNNVPAQNNTYTFHTVNAQVELENSSGQLIDEGTVKYYAGAWRDFGSTVNGVASKELLPVNYSFRMTYEYGSNDKQQDISSNPTVVFPTVNAAVQLQNSTGSLIDQGTVQYYAGAWRDFGTTINGVSHKELLPNNYSFRMTYEYVSIDKQQDFKY